MIIEALMTLMNASSNSSNHKRSATDWLLLKSEPFKNTCAVYANDPHLGAVLLSQSALPASSVEFSPETRPENRISVNL